LRRGQKGGNPNVKGAPHLKWGTPEIKKEGPKTNSNGLKGSQKSGGPKFE